MGENGTERLESWKEIAGFIGRDQRTAMRWAKRGMPVRREPAEKRGRVFAYRHELTAWMESRSTAVSADPLPTQGSGATATRLDEASPGAGAGLTPVAAVPFASARLTRTRPLLTIIAIAATVIALMSLVTARRHASASAFKLQRLTNDGRQKGSLRTDGTNLYFNESDGVDSALMMMPVGRGPARRIDTAGRRMFLRDVSSDGRQLLVDSRDAVNNTYPLWVVPVSGGDPFPVGDARCAEARWSPDNRLIACLRPSEVLLLNSDGSILQRSDRVPPEPVYLTWSPAGDRLRFFVDDTTPSRQSTWELTARNGVFDSEAQPLRLGPNCCSAFTWTRSGKRFLYAGSASDDESLLTEVDGSQNALKWSSAQSEIALRIGRIDEIEPGKSDREFYLEVTDKNRCELLKFDRKKKTFEAFLAGVSGTYLAFSRDGKWIAYVNTPDETLWRSWADGSHAEQLTQSPMQIQLSSWSPDGGTIAFMGRQAGRPWRIFLMDAASRSVREAANGTDNQGAPTWSPDGRWISYANVLCADNDPCEIRRIEISSGRTEAIPESRGYRTARWSPDGRYIAALKTGANQVALFDLTTGHRRTLGEAVTGDDLSWSADSGFIYASSPFADRLEIERISIADGRRERIADLSSLPKLPGWREIWFGLTPDESPIFAHHVTATEIYALEFAED